MTTCCCHTTVAPPSTPNIPHRHAEVIKAWADGRDVEIYVHDVWMSLPRTPSPAWEADQYRIKPPPIKTATPPPAGLAVVPEDYVQWRQFARSALAKGGVYSYGLTQGVIDKIAEDLAAALAERNKEDG